MTSLYEMLQPVFNKEEFPKDWQPFLVNRFLSYSSQTSAVALKMDKYIFWIDKELMESIYHMAFPKMKQPWFHYIKKGKKEDDPFEIVCKEFQRVYRLSDSDLKAANKVIHKIFSDKEKLREFLVDIGAEDSLYKKLEVN